MRHCYRESANVAVVIGYGGFSNQPFLSQQSALLLPPAMPFQSARPVHGTPPDLYQEFGEPMAFNSMWVCLISRVSCRILDRMLWVPLSLATFGFSVPFRLPSSQCRPSPSSNNFRHLAFLPAPSVSSKCLSVSHIPAPFLLTE